MSRFLREKFRPLIEQLIADPANSKLPQKELHKLLRDHYPNARSENKESHGRRVWLDECRVQLGLKYCHRMATKAQMQCAVVVPGGGGDGAGKCGARMLIVDGYLVCETGNHGRLVAADKKLIAAWPDRVISGQGQAMSEGQRAVQSERRKAQQAKAKQERAARKAAKAQAKAAKAHAGRPGNQPLDQAKPLELPPDQPLLDFLESC